MKLSVADLQIPATSRLCKTATAIAWISVQWPFNKGEDPLSGNQPSRGFFPQIKEPRDCLVGDMKTW